MKTSLLSKIAILFCAVGLAVISARAVTPIADVFVDLNGIHKWNDANGDTWDPFWADDDNLYAFNCDGRGFGKQGRNFAFNELQGDSVTSLTGRLVNSMDAYGKSGQKEKDGATWKALGQECIDSVFYAFVSRHTYGKESKDPLMRQTAVNCSLIKSEELTWTRSAAENYANPMWPGPRFGAPYFVHYGKNGGQVLQDGADRFVYVISNNGFWNGGDDYILGRVARNKIAALNTADWTYFTGGNGMDAKNWSGKIESAAPILTAKAQCGSGPACFVPSLGIYLMTVWYIPVTLKKWFEPQEMKYDFYQAEHPWGPWRFVSSLSDHFIVGGHMYGPVLCAKFQQQSGADAVITLFTSGCPFEDKPAGLYKMWSIPLVLKTTPTPASKMINDDDPAIKYTGNWTHSGPGRRFHDFNDDIHSATNVNDSAEFSFAGSGIDYVAEKFHDHGSVDVFLDSEFKQNVNLMLTNFPRIAQVTVFSAQNLRPGPHTIKIVNKTSDYAILDAFRVYGDATAEKK